jgi:predicted porin
MKKSLLALAALTAFAGAASAQSSVTLFGIVDAAYAHVSAGGKSASGITNSGLNSSRLGFRGVEDLGGGMRAIFWIEGALSNDDGNAAGQTWQRRSTVALAGGFGEIRLGRDYTPSFWNTTVYDPFGTNGIGQALTPGMIGAASATANGSAAVRSNNTIGYFLPAMGGITGQFQIGFGEQLLRLPPRLRRWPAVDALRLRQDEGRHQRQRRQVHQPRRFVRHGLCQADVLLRHREGWFWCTGQGL